MRSRTLVEANAGAGAMGGSLRLLARPALLYGLLAGVLFATFVVLGLWQYRKGEHKVALQRLYEARAKEPAIDLRSALGKPEALIYRKVRVRGTYEPQWQVFLDNRVSRAGVGLHVITPLHIAGSDARILINRGWIPMPRDRTRIPAIPTPLHEVEVSGVAVLPGKKFFTLSGGDDSATRWQPLRQNLDMQRYAGAVPFSVQPLIVLLEPESDASGFGRDWPRPDERAEKHFSYAFQWFGMAVAVVGIYAAVCRKRA